MENASDSDLPEDSDSEDEEDCEIADSEEQVPARANAPALGVLIASSRKNGAFDSAFTYQRGPKSTERTLFNRPQWEREPRKAAENTPTLHTFFPTTSGRPAIPPSLSPILSTNERNEQERCAAISALEKKLASKKECEVMNGQTLMRYQVVLAFLRQLTNHANVALGSISFPASSKQARWAIKDSRLLSYYDCRVPWKGALV